MIRFILLNILFVIAYLWGIENNRHLCLMMWFVVPFVDMFLYWLLIERECQPIHTPKGDCKRLNC